MRNCSGCSVNPDGPAGGARGRRRPAAGTPDRSPSAPAAGPSRRRPGRSPFGVGEDPPAGGGEEGVVTPSDLGVCPVHRAGDLVLRTARQILAERRRVHFAPRPPSLRGRSFSAFGNVIGNGHSGLQTRCMTGSRGARSNSGRRVAVLRFVLSACVRRTVAPTLTRTLP